MACDTKARILEAAEPIMIAKGFHALGIAEVLEAAKVPKGSFYHHFESKEGFGVALVEHYAGGHNAFMREFFAKGDLKPSDRILAWFSMGLSRAVEHAYGPLCLICKLSAEVSTFGEPMRKALAQEAAVGQEVLAQAIAEGQKSGDIAKKFAPAPLAALMLSAWTGALQEMQVRKNLTPLQQSLDTFRQLMVPV